MTGRIRDFSMDIFSLQGKVAIITGANQGLGMGYAYALAKAGADIFIPHLTPNIAEIREMITGLGRRVEFLQGDLTDKKHIDDIVQKCLEKFGRIDILINNAGTNHFSEFLEFPDDEFDRVLAVNMKAVYYLSHRVAKVMVRQRSGKIINIASALSFTADKMCPAYVAAKHAVIGITRTFANELGKYNIQTNAIAPGFFVTDVNKEISSNKEFYDKITGRIPAGRWGETADLMGTAVFLASSASDYINGWTISVDGGFTTTL
jgi:2-deoxy-D-gluconate 3-dehydrogenase